MNVWITPKNDMIFQQGQWLVSIDNVKSFVMNEKSLERIGCVKIGQI